MRRMILYCLICLGLLAGCGEPEVRDAPGVLETPVARVRLTPTELMAMRTAFASPERDAVMAAVARLAAAEPPIAWLLEGLLDPNRGVREWSAHALGDIAPQDDSVVRALVVRFEDEDDYVRWKAARALGNIGWPARIAFPLLAVAAAAADADEVEVVRAAARVAVQKIRRAEPPYQGAGGFGRSTTLPGLALWERKAQAPPGLPAEALPPR